MDRALVRGARTTPAQQNLFQVNPSSDHARPAPRPVVLTVAPVNYRDPHRFPSRDALVDDICACHAEGASVVHFHVTDDSGRATADTSFFDEVVRRVQRRCDIIVQGSTGGVGVAWDVRIAALAAHGLEMGSLNMGSCNLFGRAYINTPDEILRLAAKLAEANVMPDMCFFEPGFFAVLDNLPNGADSSLARVASICLGFPGALSATVENLVFMISKLPASAAWTLVHHGAQDVALLAAALAAGGNIRVGFEDSEDLGGGRRGTTNAELVRKAAKLIALLDRRVATPAETRLRYGISRECARRNLSA